MSLIGRRSWPTHLPITTTDCFFLFLIISFSHSSLSLNWCSITRDYLQRSFIIYFPVACTSSRMSQDDKLIFCLLSTIFFSSLVDLVCLICDVSMYKCDSLSIKQTLSCSFVSLETKSCFFFLIMLSMLKLNCVQKQNYFSSICQFDLYANIIFLRMNKLSIELKR